MPLFFGGEVEERGWMGLMVDFICYTLKGDLYLNILGENKRFSGC